MSPAVLILLAAGLLLSWLAGVAYTAWVLTHPPRRTSAWAVARSLPSTPGELSGAWGAARAFEEWRLELGASARGGNRAPPPPLRGASLPVWDVRGDRADGPVVVWLHGWGESRVVALSRLGALAAGASRVLMIDLPGHGEARGRGGRRCTLGVHEAAVVPTLLERAGVAPAAAVLAGSSLGSGVALAAAVMLADRGSPVGGVFMEAPYRVPATPAENVLRARGLPTRAILRPALTWVGWRMGAPRGWLREGGAFDRAALAARIAEVAPTTRLCVLHGDQDSVCPLADGRAIAEAARGEIRVVEGGGHLDLWTEHRQRAGDGLSSIGLGRTGLTARGSGGR